MLDKQTKAATTKNIAYYLKNDRSNNVARESERSRWLRLRHGWLFYGSGVATSPVALCWMCSSPRMGYARKTIMYIYIYMWRKQAIIEWSRHVNSIVACCHGAKLCAHTAWDFRSQQNGAVTRMWRLRRVQPSHKERAISVVRCKKEMLLQPLRWCCVKCVIHHERDVCEKNTIRLCGVNKQ